MLSIGINLKLDELGREREGGGGGVKIDRGRKEQRHICRQT